VKNPTKPPKAKKAKIIVEEDEDRPEELERVSIFHAVGKVLHNKREFSSKFHRIFHEISSYV
jgi:hypothetical protein